MFCDTNFPSVQSCSQPGVYIATESGMRFQEQDMSSLSADSRQMVCVTAQLQTEFKKSDEDRDGYSFSYVGTWLGSFRKYPAVKDPKIGEFCQDYNPLVRPWYMSAATGAKNIIIMIDTSGLLG